MNVIPVKSSYPLGEMDTLLERLSDKCMFVTGGGGFIGSAVLRLVKPHARELRALLGAPGDKVWEPPGGMQTSVADIRDFEKLVKLMQRVDVVVHAAGSPSVRASFEEPTKCAAVHILGTTTLMEACRKTQVRRFVYVSSAEVYGRPHSNPVREDCPMRPLSPYGAAKTAAETLVRIMAQQAKMQLYVLRPFSVYGPRQSPYSLAATIVSQATEGKEISLHDLQPVRDYCYVQDVAEAIAMACVADVNDCTCNIGSGQGTSVKRLAEMILAEIGAELPICQKASRERPVETEIYELISDIRTAATVLGWQPRTSLAAGLRETIAWIQECGS